MSREGRKAPHERPDPEEPAAGRQRQRGAARKNQQPGGKDEEQGGPKGPPRNAKHPEEPVAGRQRQRGPPERTSSRAAIFFRSSGYSILLEKKIKMNPLQGLHP